MFESDFFHFFIFDYANALPAVAVAPTDSMNHVVPVASHDVHGVVEMVTEVHVDDFGILKTVKE